MSTSVPDPSTLAAPRTTGEVITEAVDALRRSFGVVFAIGVVFCAVDLFLRELGQTLFKQFTVRSDALTTSLDACGAVQAGLAANPAGADCQMSVLGAQVPSILASLAGLVGTGIAGFLVQLLLAVGVVSVGAALVRGEASTVTGALRRIGARGAAAVGAGLHFGFRLAAVLVVSLVIAAVLSAIAWTALDLSSSDWQTNALLFVDAALLLVPLVVLALRWLLFVVVVVTEERSSRAALRRSAELTAPRGLPFFETPRFRLSVLLLIGFTLVGVQQLLALVPRFVIAWTSGWTPSDGALPGLASLPPWFMVPFGLVDVAVNAVLLPFSTFLLFFFALDLRVRYEGADVDGDSATAARPR